MKRYAFFILSSFLVVFAINLDCHAASSNTGGSIWFTGDYTPSGEPPQNIYTPSGGLPSFGPPSPGTISNPGPGNDKNWCDAIPAADIPPGAEPCERKKDYCTGVWEAPTWSEDKTVFKPACYLHDQCYANRNKDNNKIKCDAEFVINIAEACGEKFYNDLEKMLKCDVWATGYLAGVTFLGAPFYDWSVEDVYVKQEIIKAFNAGDIPTIFDLAHSAAQFLPVGSTVSLAGSVGVGGKFGKAGVGIDLISAGASITHAKDGKTIVEFPLDIGSEGSMDFIIGVSGGAQLSSTGYIEISPDGQTYAFGRKIGVQTDVGVSLSTPTPGISGGIESSWQPYAYENYQINMPKRKWEELSSWEKTALLLEVKDPVRSVGMVVHGETLDALNSDVTAGWSFESGISKYDGAFISVGGGAVIQGEGVVSIGYITEM